VDEKARTVKRISSG